MGQPVKIGYARVSTVDQNLSLQLDALTAAGCGRIFEDRQSGAKTDRPGLRDALDFARPGDVLVVWKLDRLARSVHDLLAMAADFEQRGIELETLTGAKIDTTTATGRMAFYMFAAVAELERDVIRERCEFRLKLDSDSSRNWTAIPAQTGH